MAASPRESPTRSTKKWFTTRRRQHIDRLAADYLVPTMAEIPGLEIHHLESLTEASVTGAKGVGEGGTIGAPAAVLNAVSDALAPFGVGTFEMPITPQRILQLLREAGLVGASHRHGGPTTTRRNKDDRPAPDLVDRDFNAAGPNQLWVADITYVPTMAGFLYLAVVLDAWSRKIVGWAMANHLRAELVLDAMAMAVGQRRPKDVIHHSDQGSQYTSVAFGKRCGEAGVRPSMGSVGDAYDNAMAESFFSTLEAELLGRRRFASQAEAKMACFSYIEGWYNPVRLHSGLGYRSPITYEADMQAAMTKTVDCKLTNRPLKRGN